ncbi:MAG: 50S ribosomal protein L10 [Candidatus Aenigmarchaeota archaeon]|nr:50S ribosomal protein L10 [Candidatus Aenigmarchaeota archaeon]
MMVSEKKINEVEKLRELIDNYSVIGILNMYKMPSPQLQEMKKMLKDRAKIRMSKKVLIKLALEKSRHKDIKKLEEYMKGQPALILTNMNPFKLFRFLDENKTPAPAKAGDIAQNDIVVHEGSTGLPPGPAIGQLSDVGIISKVQDGKIYIMKDKTIAKEGDVITPELAGVLGLLGIKPMKIGLDLLAVYENGIIFDKNVLRIDEEEFKNKLMKSIRGAINLSLNSSYITKLTAPLAIQTAYIKAKNLALNASIYNKDSIKDLLVKAYLEGTKIKSLIHN